MGRIRNKVYELTHPHFYSSTRDYMGIEGLLKVERLE